MCAYLDDVEENVLTALALLEELHLGVGARDVASDELLARRAHLEETAVGGGGGVDVAAPAQALPRDAAVRARYPLPDVLLRWMGKQ